MEKLLHKHVRHVGHALIMAVLFFLWGGYNVAASAEGSGTVDDPYILKVGEAANVLGDVKSYYKFTPTVDGELRLPQNPGLLLFDDAAYTKQSAKQPTFNNNWSNPKYLQKCTAGTTYYIATSWVNYGAAFTFEIEYVTEAESIKLTVASPENGETIDLVHATVDLTFNQSVIIGGCTISANGKTKSLTVNGYGVYASADAKAALKAWYDDGIVVEGTDVTVTFTGIKATADNTIIYGTDGTLVLNYKAGAKPMLMTGSTNTPVSTTSPMAKLKSYYMSDDNTGIVTLTFDKELSWEAIPTVTLSCGNPESDYYIESITPNILGNTIAINLRNKLRNGTAFDAPQEGATAVYVTLKVSGVKDVDGNYAYTDDIGSVGSFSFVYEYEKVSYDVLSEWTPDPETVKITADTKELGLYLYEEGAKAKFDGAKIDYTENGEAKSVQIPNNQLNVVVNDTEGTTITIPMPNITVDANTTLTVALNAVERPDGLEDLTAYTATYNCEGITAEVFNVTEAKWKKNETETVDLLAQGASIDVLTNGTTTVFKTNKDDEIGYVTLEVRGPAEAPEAGFVANKYKSTIVPDGEGGSTIVPFTDGISFEWFGESLFEGYDYTFTLKAWKSEDDFNYGLDPTVGETSFVVKGAKKSYVYSDVKLLTDISEDFIILNKDDNYRTFEFSGPVTLTAVVNTGFGTSVDCAVEKANDEGTAWKVTIPETILSSYEIINVNLFVKDENGKAVNKTDNGLGVSMGSEDNTWFQVNFVSEFNKPDFTVEPAPDSELESISKITFTYAPISQNWNCTEKITVYDRTERVVLYEFSGNDIEYEADNSKAYLTLPEPITKPGTYDIEIPASFFMLGEDMMSSTSKQTSVTYVIPGSTPSPEIKVTITPAAGSVQEIPADILLVFDNMFSVADTGINPVLTDANNVDYPASWTYDWTEELNYYHIALTNGAIKADGTYTLTIPAGALTFNDDPDIVNTEDIVFIYTIGTTGIDSLVASEGGKVDVYTINGTTVLRNADAAAVKTLAKGLYIINGKKVVIK